MRLLLVGTLLACISVPAWTAEDVDPEDLEAEAVAMLDAMIDYLGDTKTFLMRAESGYDVLQDNGQMLEFGGVRSVLVDKPNRARFDLERRDGFKGSLILDGETLWYVTPEQKTYGSLPQPGNLDASLDYAEDELGLSQQLADFVAIDPYAGLKSGLRSAAVIGPAEILGVACTHLAFRNDIADFQLWVASEGDPMLKRMVVTYRDEPGNPQFWATVAEFNDDVKVSDSSFRFEPPDDYARLRFLVPSRADTDADLD